MVSNSVRVISLSLINLLVTMQIFCVISYYLFTAASIQGLHCKFTRKSFAKNTAIFTSQGSVHSLSGN